MQYFLDAITAESPDLMICDFYTVHGQRAIDKAGIPQIIHAQVNIDMMQSLND